MKILISACVFGKNVRWNGSNKNSEKIKKWARDNEIELVPVCPEDELFGTPRSTIKLIQIENEICAKMAGKDITGELDEKTKQLYERFPDAKGFIGIYGSPSCGISVGVKNLGKVTKGFMHKNADIPTVEIGQLKKDSQKEIFLNRIENNCN